MEFINVKDENKKNLFVAIEWLKMGINNTLSEYPINEYIKFMDSLTQTERDFILMNNQTTNLINKLNEGLK